MFLVTFNFLFACLRSFDIFTVKSYSLFSITFLLWCHSKRYPDISVPYHGFNQKQGNWYASYVVAAILNDWEINVSEIDYIRHVITLVIDPEEKQKLSNFLKQKNYAVYSNQ